MEAEVGWAPSLLLFFVVVTVDTCSIGKPSIANAPATHNPSVNQKANMTVVIVYNRLLRLQIGILLLELLHARVVRRLFRGLERLDALLDTPLDGLIDFLVLFAQ